MHCRSVNQERLANGQKPLLRFTKLQELKGRPLMEQLEKIAEKEVLGLDLRGSTHVYLENLFVTRETPPTGSNKDRWKYDATIGLNGGWKRYVQTPIIENGVIGERFDSEFGDMMAGIMECLKYHFAPFSLKDANGNWDCELIDDLLPLLKGTRLHQKFGAFYNVKELGLNYQKDPDAVDGIDQEDLGEVFHPETGEPMDRSQYNYVIIDSSKVYHDREEGLRLKVSDKHIRYFKDEPENLLTCVRMMQEYLHTESKDIIKDTFRQLDQKPSLISNQ